MADDKRGNIVGWILHWNCCVCCAAADSAHILVVVREAFRTGCLQSKALYIKMWRHVQGCLKH